MSTGILNLVTGKIITSSNSLLPAKSSFSNILLKSVVTIYFITGKILKVFDKVSETFDLVRNWAVVDELMSLPVAIISSL